MLGSRKAIDVVGLTGRDSAYLKALSGGMQQRVQIARALLLEPRVLLMDEPFGALDALTKAALQDTLLQLHERTGVTVIFITHDLEEAIYLSDSVYVIAGVSPERCPSMSMFRCLAPGIRSGPANRPSSSPFATSWLSRSIWWRQDDRGARGLARGTRPGRGDRESTSSAS